MNLDVWNSLPQDIQKVMDDLVEEHTIWTGREFHEHSVEGFMYAIDVEGCEAITLPEAEKAKMMERFKPLVDKYLADTAAKGLPGKEALDELYRLKEKYDAMYVR